MSFKTIYVIGAGAWGTALAQASALAGRDVVLVGRDAAFAKEFNRSRTNPKYLGAQKLSERIKAQTGFAGLADADAVIMAVPAQTTRASLEAIGPDVLAGKPVVLSAKGFEAGSLMRQSEVLESAALGAVPYVLSGPSFAIDVAAGRPTAVTLAGRDGATTDALAVALASTSFRPYASGDVAGVELAGGLKNIYALACGAVDGAGLGLSARASVLARAFAEMSRLVEALGGQSATMGGLAGLGDLALSCTSEQSRNYHYGVLLGRGLGAQEIADQTGLAEGVKTAPVALEMAQKVDADVPLIEAVNLLLGGTMNIETIAASLMGRPLKREGED